MFHQDKTYYERRDAQEHFKTCDQFYNQLISITNKNGKIGLLSEMLAEWAHSTIGRRRWLITKEMANILYEIPIDPDMTGIAWPYDAWSLCFEEGTIINGIPFKWMRIFSAKSQLIKEIISSSLTPFILSAIL